MNKNIKLIRRWAKLRHPDKKFADTAISYFYTLQPHEQESSLIEMKTYIDGVRSGIIEKSIPKIPIKVFKNKQ